MKKLIFAFLALGLIFTSCEKEDSSDVNQNKVYSDYELFYNQNEDKTHVVARFRFGGPTGTLLELADTSDASVTFEEDPLPYNIWYGGHHKEFAGQLAGGTFVYTNTNGVSYTNEIPTGEAIAFQADFDTITKGIAEDLTWDGTALSANQHVGVFVGSWTWGEDASFWTGDLGATEIVMGVLQKNDLALGSSTVYMDRSTALDVAQGTPEGGRIRYKYRCTNAAVAVVE
ncbi:MAG: hypothetical protein GQ574_27525 [Crocinitomix sp.]|nr:hypothetical protein [Crocinitomix sp.]